MSFVIAAAAVTAGVGAYKAINGANQVSAANRLAKQNIFTPEEMPYEVGLGTDLAARNYINGMPGTADATNNINRNAASSFYRGSQGATSGGDVLDLATRIGQGTNAATNQLVTQQAQYKSGALGEYENALGNQANWQKQLYNNNTLQPYLRTAKLAASMYGAGKQNTYSGLDDIASVGTGLAKGLSNTPDPTTPRADSPYLQAGGAGYTPYSPPQQQVTPYQIPKYALSTS